MNLKQWSPVAPGLWIPNIILWKDSLWKIAESRYEVWNIQNKSRISYSTRKLGFLPKTTGVMSKRLRRQLERDFNWNINKNNFRNVLKHQVNHSLIHNNTKISSLEDVRGSTQYSEHWFKKGIIKISLLFLIKLHLRVARYLMRGCLSLEKYSRLNKILRKGW